MKIEEAIKGIESLRAQLGSLEKFLHKINREEKEPKKVKKWVNLYRSETPDGVKGCIHNTKKGADINQLHSRLVCVEIEVEE